MTTFNQSACIIIALLCLLLRNVSQVSDVARWSLVASFCILGTIAFQLGLSIKDFGINKW